MNIAEKDLNLLMVFQALMMERTVSRAARRVGLSQPALSHALSRLRRDFSDDLFVRAKGGMTPTPKAALMAEPILNALTQIEKLYHTSFDPKQDSTRWVLGTTDYFEQILFPLLLPYMRNEAPNMVAITRPLLGYLPKEELETGEMDLAVAGYFGDLPVGFYQKKLFDETFTCVVRDRHPVLKKKFSFETFLSLEHLLVSPQGDLEGVVDRVLAKQKKKRKIVAGLSSFYSPALIVVESDYIVTVPTRLAQMYATYYPIRCLPPPVEIPSFRMMSVWHARTHHSPVHVWIRKQIELLLTEKK